MDVYGVLAFYLITLKDDEYTLKPIIIKDAQKFFNSCPPEGKKAPRFPELLPPDETVQQGTARLGDPASTLTAIHEQEIQSQESRAKLQNAVVHRGTRFKSGRCVLKSTLA